jgi:hypothetical protein
MGTATLSSEMGQEGDVEANVGATVEINLARGKPSIKIMKKGQAQPLIDATMPDEGAITGV